MTDVGSDLELTVIFRQYAEPIRRYALSLVHDAAEAEDITQETFLRVHQRIPGLRDPAKLSPWLYRIATNLAYDRLRKSSRQPQVRPLGDAESTGAEPADSKAPRLDRLIEQEEMSSCVHDYLEALPDSYRAAILMHDLQGLSNPEIAQILGISLAAVKIRVHRARKRLREALGQGCSFSHDERNVLVCEPKSGTDTDSQ